VALLLVLLSTPVELPEKMPPTIFGDQPNKPNANFNLNNGEWKLDSVLGYHIITV
jgi:hypothetical protein